MDFVMRFLQRAPSKLTLFIVTKLCQRRHRY
jgi:hypothetical protein